MRFFTDPGIGIDGRVFCMPAGRTAGEEHAMGARKTTRAFEKDKAAFFAKCRAQHAPCWICGQPIDYSVPKNTTDDSYSMDHFLPVSTHPDMQFDPAGFRPSHTNCNRARGNKDPYQPIGRLSRVWADESAV